jgi:photosystem II stability/assembly factor-like uncharacterized protein
VSCSPSGDTPAQLITIFRTDDGGRSWDSSAVRAYDPSVIMMVFVSPTTGWLVPERYNIAGPPLAEALFMTRDSGIHWTSISLGHSNLQVLGFQSPTRGYADTDSPSSLPQPDFSHFPYVTNNAGRTWGHPRVPIPNGYGQALITSGPVGFTGRLSAAIPVSLSVPSSNSSGCTVYHTKDGGAQWSHTALSSICGANFFNASVGWGNGIGSSASTVYRTTDGGQRWLRLSHTDITPGPGSFITPSTGFMLSPNDGQLEIFESHNAGATWQVVKASLSQR